MPYLELGGDELSALNVEPSYPNQNKDSALIFSLDRFVSIPEVRVSPTDENSDINLNTPTDIVMVVPTAINPQKELTVGFVFLGIFTLCMFVFAFFVYIGYKQYKQILHDKPLTDLEKTTLKSESFAGSFDDTNKNSSDSGNNDEKNLNLLVQRQTNSLKSFSMPLQLRPFSLKNNDNLRSNNFVEFSHKSMSNDRNGIKNISYSNNTENMFSKKESRYNEKVCKDDLNTSLACETKTPIEILEENKKIDNVNIDTPTDFNENKRKSSISVYLNETNVVVKKGIEQVERNHGKKLVYSMKKLIELEPVWLYQLFEYNYCDGDLLVTDIIFSEIPVVVTNDFNKIESLITNIRFSLMSQNNVAPSIKILELFSFITLSIGVKQFNNPNIFTLAYGTLLENIIQLEVLSQIPDISPFIESGFIETVIMYCINCWKFDKTKHSIITTTFEKWGQEIYVPNKVKLYKHVVSLILQGYRFGLLKELLIFFSMETKIHCLHSILIEALEIESRPEVKQLFQYLIRQHQIKHASCCGNTDNWKHWDLLTTGFENESIVEPYNEIDLPKPESALLLRDFNLPKTNSIEYKTALNIITEEQTENNEIVSNHSDNLKQNHRYETTLEPISEENKILQSEILTFVDLNSNKYSFSPTNILPGSLAASPTHVNSRNL